MLSTSRVTGAILALFVSAAAAHAQTVEIARPSLSPDRRSITVFADGPPYPDPALISEKQRYLIVLRSPANPAGHQVAVAGVAPEPGLYADTGLLRITLADAVPADVTEIDVVSLFEKAARVTWSPRKPAGAIGIHGVDKRDKADVYLFGSWLTGVDLSPVYNLDFVVGAPISDVSIAGQPWRLSAKATLKTADRRDVDPDAYSVSLGLGRVYPKNLGKAGPYLDVQWSALKAEFSRKEEASNLITAPVVTFSRRLGASLREDKTVKAAADLDIQAGLELGRNLQNEIAPEGYGTIARLVPGVALYAAFPKAFGLEELRWTTTYRARILLAAEPMIDARDDENPRSSIARGTRHEWKDELAAKVTPILSLTLTHDYGSLPPAFKILDHRVSLGATVMWAWKK